jgi:transposase
MKKATAELKVMVFARRSPLMDLRGVGPVLAAWVLADVGDVSPFADRNRFALLVVRRGRCRSVAGLPSQRAQPPSTRQERTFRGRRGEFPDAGMSGHRLVKSLDLMHPALTVDGCSR